MKGDRRKISMPPVDVRKDRDDDLLLFFEMRRCEKDRTINLLQPVSEEFEPNSGNGNYPLYRIPSAKKGTGNDFLDIHGKNDYDWLKTPPATPLFPSLEMEAAGSDLVIQKEIPILQPIRLSRFSSKTEPSKDSKPNTDTKSPKPKPSVSSRSITPTSKTSVSGKNSSTPKGISDKTAKWGSNPNKASSISSISAKPTNPKELTPKTDTNSPKQRANVSDPKPRSRGVSPMVRSRIPATIPGFSDETPPNLKTTISDRSTSASRGRPANSTADVKQDIGKQRRQSCSPSVTRGRKPEIGQESKGKIATGNGSLLLGSRMVEKVMNARKSNGPDEKDPKPKYRVSGNENSGFGRMISKGSLDMALKHMEIKRNPINFHHYNTIGVRKPSSSNSSLNLSPRRTVEEDESENLESWRGRRT
ncbi:uncharacterized protein LOC131240276 [Magnolia sinica]|uniref:uncharacterized protein LOC131240276 n=1 Tax=Magnolia sinica TaxID=86752 RepID=UPI002659C3B6|nr:uncharacterized protein LOC131240276 [Magnolia sinica]